jgi:hypothetical protein
MGEYSGNESLPVHIGNGRVSSPKHSINQRLAIDRDSEHYTIIAVSEDCSSILTSQNNVGRQLVKTIKNFKRDPKNQTYVDPYGQAIEVISTFSTYDVGITVLEGGCSWIVGKEETPSWAKAAKTTHRDAKKVQELILALRQDCYVNLFSAKIRSLAIEHF